VAPAALCSTLILHLIRSGRRKAELIARETKRLKTIGDAFCNEGGQPSDQLNSLVVDVEALVTAAKVGMLPRWNRPISDGNLKMHLAMREVHVKLSAALFNEARDSGVVTGMPGIGKSWFVDAFASFLIERGCAALLECDVPSLYEVAKGKKDSSRANCSKTRRKQSHSGESVGGSRCAEN